MHLSVDRGYLEVTVKCIELYTFFGDQDCYVDSSPPTAPKNFSLFVGDGLHRAEGKKKRKTAIPTHRYHQGSLTGGESVFVPDWGEVINTCYHSVGQGMFSTFSSERS